MPLGGGSRGGAAGGAFDVTTCCVGAGSAGVPPRAAVLAGGGISAATVSAGGSALEVNEIFECAAVVRMALRRRRLFCGRLEGVDGVITLALVPASEEDGRSSAAVDGASLAPRFLCVISSEELSTIGQMNPVRGVKSGRRERNVSSEDCKE
jgi:hypothetical protein